MVTDLGYKIFLMFATINIGAMATFSLCVSFASPATLPLSPHMYLRPLPCFLVHIRLIPETKGRSLEEMDVIFGSVSADQRQRDIARQERGEQPLFLLSPILKLLRY